MAGGGVLGVATGALMAYQRAMQTTSHNIANVNTPGYSRQTVEIQTRPPEISGEGLIGTGVSVSGITRVYDQYLTSQITDGTSSKSEMGAYYDLASRIDNMLADPQAGLSPGLDAFFNAVQGVANDPSSTAARQVMLSQGSALADRFHFLQGQLDSLNKTANTQIQNMVTEINTMASDIADLNKQIVSVMGQSGGQPPNDLLDQRDQMITKLAQDVGVTTVTQSDGSINVFVGNGQALVAGANTQPLAVINNQYDPTRYEIGYKNFSSTSLISDQLAGGTLGGVLNFRKQVLDPAQNALGRVALGVTTSFNRQHALGTDLNGAAGGDFFNEAVPFVAASSKNAGTGAVSAALVSSRDLTSSGYVLKYGGGNNYTLTRLSDNKTFNIDTGGSTPYTSEEVDGFSLTISSGAAVGDSFLISPTRDGASAINVQISDTSKIAAAAAIRTSASYTNGGNVVINAGTVNSPDNKVTIQFISSSTYNVVDNTTGATLAQGLSYTSGGNIRFNGWTVQVANGATPPAAGDRFYIDHTVTTADAANTSGANIGPATVAARDPNLTDPVTITFTSPTTYTVTGATTGTPAVSVPYTSGQPISFNGWTVTLSGTPAPGDTFTVGANTNGTGDNRNALQLASLQTQQTLAGGTTTYQGAYGQMVVDVGARTSEAKNNSDARTTMLNQLVSERASASGVNLDEEAANLVQYQQAYQAAAQVITIANSLFQTMLGAVSR